MKNDTKVAKIHHGTKNWAHEDYPDKDNKKSETTICSNIGMNAETWE